MRILTLVALTGLLLLTGCNQAQRYQTAEQVAADSTVEKDPYKAVVWTRTPHIYARPIGFFFRHFETKYGSEKYQLYINFMSSDWVFFDQAYDSDGRRLDFVKIDRDVRYGGSVKEAFAINFPRSYLEEKAKGDGLNIKFVGKRGEQILLLRPIWVEGFLMKVDNPDADFSGAGD